MVFGREQHEREQRRRHHGRGVGQVRDQVRAQREAQAAHERAHALGAQPPQIEEDEHGGGGQRDEHEELEGGERRGHGQDGHQWIQRARTVGGEERGAEEDGRVPRGQVAALVALPHQRAQREMQGGAVARTQQPARRPGRGVGQGR